ncbi:MAG: isochorismate synthase [Candidatus Zixiibacteriota bacterium]
MTYIASDTVARTITDAARTLREKLERNTETPVRQDVRIEAIDLLAWLAAQINSNKFYWKSREIELEIAGIGVAGRISLDADRSLADVEAQFVFPQAHGRTEPRYFGGMRFDYSPSRKNPEWAPFGNALFILPQVELVRSGRDFYLACNLVRQSERENLIRALGSLAEPVPVADTDIQIGHGQVQTPGRREWEQMLSRALGLIRSKQIQKIVLARQVAYEAKERIEPWGVLSRLRRLNGASFMFGFQADDGTAFIGASPEKLYCRTGPELTSEAVAGTAPRSGDQNEDRRLGERLLASPKDIHEQHLVLESLKSSLEPYATKLRTEPVELLKLNGLQHLISKIEVTLRSGITDTQLLTAVHPTPAVGGVPREFAMKMISQLEPFDRGWYAGPVGWVGAESAEFAVAIRSILVCGNRLTAYAGSGIVDGSDPEDEWAETEQKFASFVNALLSP